MRGSAKAYERYLVPLFFAPGAQFLIELAALKGGEQVLDVACGTGIVARTVAQRVGNHGTVIGLDLNEDMLEVAHTTSSNIQSHIEWRKGDVKEIPFQDSSFNVVFCQQGLQFFPDKLAALPEIQRVLKVNCRFALSAMRPIKHNPSYAILAEALERHVGTDAGVMMRSPFISLNTEELRDLILSSRIPRPTNPFWYTTRTIPFNYRICSEGRQPARHWPRRLSPLVTTYFSP